MRKTEMEKMTEFKKIFIKDLNQALICALCSGYLIDATTLTECNHVFCRGCILRYFESNKAVCPTCNIVCKKKNQNFFRSDPQLQSIVYKVVPGLFSREMQRREDFYRSTGVRASSSCSDDSVFERERDMINDDEVLIASHVGDKTQFFGTEDSISLSLEYYQRHLDGSEDTKCGKVDESDKNIATQNINTNNNNNNSEVISAKHKLNGSNKNQKDDISLDSKSDQRFLQCPAAVAMKHLQKFIRMKFALSVNHKVDIIYKGEVLPAHFSLMDVAYTFKWTRLKPLRFFYRILVPSKIQPIKIINTTLSTGGKQLQIVPSGKNESAAQSPIKVEPEIDMKKASIEEMKKENESNREKEHLLANLQLQSKSKVQNLTENVPDKGAPQPPQIQDCVFTYDEPDSEEIKRFAEIRDREWALQKKMDENREKNIDHHHFSKKRKKSKHSKNDIAYKKRKLHAEITNEEDLKLKVKLTQHNGHKHKHHKSSSLTDLAAKKEKLLQMRQVRHKHVLSEDKNIQTVQSGSSNIPKEAIPDIKEEIKPKETVVELKNKSVAVGTLASDEAKAPNGVKPIDETKKSTIAEVNSTKNSKNESTNKQASKEWSSRVPTVQIERNELTEQQAKKSFFKSFQIYAEKYHKLLEKPLQNSKNDIGKLPQKVSPMTLTRPVPSQLERKIANLQQRCTVEAKNRPPALESKTPEKKATPQDSIKTVTTSSPYPAGFTVSKIEAGIKRKNDDEKQLQDKRPSLEITLINPPPTVETKPVTTMAKRPPPPTIPLDRIKKSFNNKSGISIIPKILPEKCDNIGALDLSAKPPSKEDAKPVNGFSTPPSVSKDGKTVNMSNLQMLSKVATEHSAINKNTNKPRPQVPNLHSLQKIPSLEKINKNQFRAMNPQIRTVRPNQNQNQSIRNIPNPSLLIRQQNQNRLNSLNPVRASTNGEKEVKSAPSSEPSNDIKPTENKGVAT